MLVRPIGTYSRFRQCALSWATGTASATYQCGADANDRILISSCAWSWSRSQSTRCGSMDLSA